MAVHPHASIVSDSAEPHHVHVFEQLRQSQLAVLTCRRYADQRNKQVAPSWSFQNRINWCVGVKLDGYNRLDIRGNTIIKDLILILTMENAK